MSRALIPTFITTLLYSFLFTSVLVLPTLAKQQQQLHWTPSVSPSSTNLYSPQVVDVVSYYNPDHDGIVQFQIIVNTTTFTKAATSLRLSLSSTHDKSSPVIISDDGEEPFLFKIHGQDFYNGTRTQTTCSIDKKVFLATMISPYDIIVGNANIDPARGSIVILFNTILVLARTNGTVPAEPSPLLQVSIPDYAFQQSFVLLTPETDKDYADEDPDDHSGDHSTGKPITNVFIFGCVALGSLVTIIFAVIVYNCCIKNPSLNSVDEYSQNFEPTNNTAIVQYYKKQGKDHLTNFPLYTANQENPVSKAFDIHDGYSTFPNSRSYVETDF